MLRRAHANLETINIVEYAVEALDLTLGSVGPPE